jgi:cystathionine beta-lyase family protein involved in aluminum resistance
VSPIDGHSSQVSRNCRGEFVEAREKLRVAADVAGVMLAATRTAQRAHSIAAARKITGRNGFNRATRSRVQ